MDSTTLLHTIFLGIIEGLTEFIPVSSTGHLILFAELIGFTGPPGQVFEITIQLGAISAICWLYREKLFSVAKELPHKQSARQFTRNILVAFLPSVIIGMFAYSFIKEVLFSAEIVSYSLIIGGIIILLIERKEHKIEHCNIEEFPLSTCLKIGLFQTLSMIPGVSRSGATIMGGLLLNVDRKTATEFSFFLAIPTILAATVYDLFQNMEHLTSNSMMIILAGFISAFISAIIVIRIFIHFVQHHNFSAFGWYRIAVGLLMLGLL